MVNGFRILSLCVGSIELLQKTKNVSAALIPSDFVYVLDVCGDWGGALKLFEINPFFSGADHYAFVRMAIISVIE